MASEAKEVSTHTGKIPLGSTNTIFKSISVPSGATHALAPIDVKLFPLRIGPNYKKHQKKAPGPDAFFDFVGGHSFLSSKKIDSIAQYLELPESKEEGIVNSIHEYLIINIQIPTFAPPNPIWGKAILDGPCYHLVHIFRMSPDGRKAIAEQITPAARLLKRFYEADEPEHMVKNGMRHRFKMIAKLMNPEDGHFNAVVRALVHQYNGKPFLTGYESHSFHKWRNTMTACLDVFRFCYLARSGCSSLISVIPKLVVEYVITVEGKEDDELPEQALCGLSMVHIDPSRAVPIEQELKKHGCATPVELRHSSSHTHK